MSQKSTISISFRLDGDASGFKKLSGDADGLRKVMGATVVEADRLKTSVVNFAALATGIDSISKTIRDLQSTLKGLTSAYAAQIEAETKLAVAMRNTMGAREEDIQSIKDLCAAQQELGVIGDEVQLSGAQELAKYLSEKQSLEKLIPVMNDMLAQQYGLNATQENAASIAAMLGKAIEGQTTALKRHGFIIDDAQEQILKFGNESQRAAVLCDVVSRSVGGMNAELAKTDAGKQKQLENTLGDIKEQLGGLVQGAMPFVTIAASATVAAGGVVKLTVAMKALVATSASGVRNIRAFWAATATLSSGTVGLTKVVATARLFISQFCTALTQGTKGLRLFATAWRGMLISTGIGAAIVAVTGIIAHFALKTDEATESTNKFLDAQERAKREEEQLERLRQQENSTLTNTRAALEINISRLKEFNGTKEQEKKLVNEMNDTYGDTMGYFSSVADWYNALISNSEAYCRQMVVEARTRMLANQIAEKENERASIQSNIDSGKYSTQRRTREVPVATALVGSIPVHTWETEEIIGTSEMEKAQKEVEDLTSEVKELTTQLNSAAKEAAEIDFNVKGTEVRPGGNTGGGDKKKDAPQWTEDASNLKEIGDNIKILQERLQTASIEEAALINQQIQSWEKKADAIRNTGKEIEKNKLQWHDQAKNLAEVTENIRILDEKLQNATVEEAAVINQQKEALEKQANAIRNAGKAVENNTPVWNDHANTLKSIGDNISILNEKLQSATIEEAALLNQQIKVWEKKAKAIRNAGEQSKTTFEIMRDGYQTIRGIGGGVENITNALEGNGNAWQTVTGIVDGFLQIYDGIKTIVGIIDLLSLATTAHTTSKTAEGVAIGATTAAQTAEAVTAETNAAAQIPVIAANKLATASYMELAAAAYFAAHAYIPFAGFGVASGFVTAATAMVEAIGVMPFANGGIITGPTIGLMGEYPGASNNPEVVAPLDRLRSLIQPQGEGYGKVEFEIDGRKLKGVLKKVDTLSSRS